LKLVRILIESLIERGGYDSDDYVQRYISFMTTPATHRDTYVEEYHRHFFTLYAKGSPPKKCGVREKHIGGLVGIPPIVIFYGKTPDIARRAALEHLSLTHLGEKMTLSAKILVDLLLDTLQGKALKESLLESMERRDSPFLGFPFAKWLEESDERVVCSRFSSACYVEDSIPSVLYLALKYHKSPEEGLIANTNLGGDNAYRGAVLGALLGAENGLHSFPERWIDGLVEPPPEMGC
jgi:ADP-ribosylglycohydrolase